MALSIISQPFGGLTPIYNGPISHISGAYKVGNTPTINLSPAQVYSNSLWIEAPQTSTMTTFTFRNLDVYHSGDNVPLLVLPTTEGNALVLSRTYEGQAYGYMGFLLYFINKDGQIVGGSDSVARTRIDITGSQVLYYIQLTLISSLTNTGEYFTTLYYSTTYADPYREPPYTGPTIWTPIVDGAGVFNTLYTKGFVEIDDEYGPESDEGGYSGGAFDGSSDKITIPNKPAVSVSSVGFVNVYKCDDLALTSLGSELFPEFVPIDGEGVVDALAGVCTNVGQGIKILLNSQLINYIIDCHIIPVSPTVGQFSNIKIGFKTMTQQARTVTSDYIDFDCGSINIKEYYTNFLDYAGTTAKLFLPFVGFVPVMPEWFQSGKLQVKYRFNIIDGSFTAFVISTSSKSQLSETVVAQYGGNACVHIPITGVNYSNMVSGLVGGTVATASGGSLAGITTGALNTMSARPSVDCSNGYNSTTAFLGVRRPYLMIERVVSQFPLSYPHENGIPANIKAKLGDLRGFTSASTIHVDIKEATESERAEIERLLAQGVIL